MNWEQLTKRHIKQFKEYFTGLKLAHDQLMADKELLLGNYTIITAPANIRDKISRDYAAWKKEWGMDGQCFTAMVETHTAEISAFLNGEDIPFDQPE